MRVAFALVLASALVACKEEWNENQIGVGNPWSVTDETEPGGESVDAASDTATTTDASSGDTTDAGPADARADARDATSG